MENTLEMNGKWFTLWGIILIVLGIAAVAAPIAASIAIELILGWLLLASGIVKALHSFRAMGSGKCILRLLGGLIYIAAGLLFLFYPLQGVITLALLLAIIFIMEGIIKTTVSLRLRPLPNWGWMLASGIAAFVLAGIIISGYPGDVAWIPGLLLGINLIFSGWTMLMLSGTNIKISTDTEQDI